MLMLVAVCGYAAEDMDAQILVLGRICVWQARATVYSSETYYHTRPTTCGGMWRGLSATSCSN
jgi:hypothetical protein